VVTGNWTTYVHFLLPKLANQTQQSDYSNHWHYQSMFQVLIPLMTGYIVFSCRFGAGVGPIWLDDVNCVGTETCLVTCPNRGIGSSSCSHFEDVAIFCAGRTGELLHTTIKTNRAIMVLIAHKSCIPVFVF